jgi:hypothetical protein
MLTETISLDCRINLRQAGLLPILAKHLHSQSKHSHKYFITEDEANQNYHNKGIVNHKDYLLVLCQTITTLSSNDDNARIFGEEGVCESVTKLFTHEIQDEGYGHGHHNEMAITLLKVIISLCTDTRNKNRHRFASCSICIPIIQLLHDFMRNIEKYNKIIPKEFARLVEYASWALLNLCLDCSENIYCIHGISFSEVVIDNLIALDLPIAAKIKLEKANEIIFKNEKFPKIVVTMIGNEDDDKKEGEKEENGDGNGGGDGDGKGNRDEKKESVAKKDCEKDAKPVIKDMQGTTTKAAAESKSNPDIRKENDSKSLKKEYK